MAFRVKIERVPNLGIIEDALKSPEELMRDIQTFRRTAFYNSIANNKDARGKRVKKLTPKYAEYKRKKWGDRPIRVASGDLIASYNSEVSGNKLTETISAEYAVYVDAERQLLPRSWNEQPDEDKKSIQDLTTKFVDNVIGESVRSYKYNS